MAQETDKQRGKRDRIERLRRRLQEVAWTSTGERQLAAIVKGILDLLNDEL